MIETKPIDSGDIDDKARELFEACAACAGDSPAAESFVRAYMDAGQNLDNRALALLPALICSGVAVATAQRLLQSSPAATKTGGLQLSFF